MGWILFSNLIISQRGLKSEFNKKDERCLECLP
nr:MAG TPA: hypothetical protein [Bacteriophage sp.]